MSQYVARKLLSSILVLLGVSVAVFLILHLSPGDPARLLAGPEAYEEDIAAIRERLGLNDPLHVQYGRFLMGVLRLDLGTSFRTGRPVIQEIAARFPHTVELAVASLLWSLPVGIAIGVFAARRPNSPGDGLSMGMALLGVSMPTFWLGLLLMLFFSYHLGWLPASGRGGSPLTWEGLRTIIMPALTLGSPAAAVFARITRSSMLQVLDLDYIRTARAKGLSERRVTYRHALRNALIPVITMAGLQFGSLLGGALVTEQVFAWPGIGTLLVNAIVSRDYPVVQGCILVIAAAFVLVNLAVDLLYSLVDPRITYS